LHGCKLFSLLLSVAAVVAAVFVSFFGSCFGWLEWVPYLLFLSLRFVVLLVSLLNFKAVGESVAALQQQFELRGLLLGFWCLNTASPVQNSFLGLILAQNVHLQ